MFHFDMDNVFVRFENGDFKCQINLKMAFENLSLFQIKKLFKEFVNGYFNESEISKLESALDMYICESEACKKSVYDRSLKIKDAYESIKLKYMEK